MYFGVFLGSFFTLFLLYELYCRPRLRTSTNVLIVIIFCSDCLRTIACAILEAVVLTKTWNTSITNCENEIPVIHYSPVIINSCRATMAIRSIFNVTQPFGFVAIAYERLYMLLKRNGNSNMNAIRLKHIFIWIAVTFFFGIVIGAYHAIAYPPSNTCYGQSDTASRVAMIIQLFCIFCAAFIGSLIYVKICFTVRKHRVNLITPITEDRNMRKRIKRMNTLQRKNIQLTKQTFIIFLSFFFWRLPSTVLVFLNLIIVDQLRYKSRCYLEEFTNLSIQLIFVATITDPLVYIWTKSALKQNFLQLRFLPLRFVRSTINDQ
ncbi:unnamed protein product [Adineta ricciae]|uniref:G-protein coupled receptors family 1 profile domain-containing protein n=1 Tax=Adineta ricciae TaxID=249248 RepID=A0A815PIZ9_ADIRI|nr:unnamed protein product [Adineta ricciae]